MQAAGTRLPNPFSILSDERSATLRFWIKKKAGFTRVLYEKIKDNTWDKVLHVSGPYSANFYLQPHTDNVVCVGVGTGTVPVMSLFATLLNLVQLVDQEKASNLL